MKTFKQYLAESKIEEAVSKLTDLFEHEVYKQIPGTSNSYRQDSANTNKKVQRHSHVFAKSNGGGSELYSVNISGSGHDGSSGIKISSSHADFFRSKGYDIKPDNILESLDLEQLQKGMYFPVLLEDA